jgi:hypothetical protein
VPTIFAIEQIWWARRKCGFARPLPFFAFKADAVPAPNQNIENNPMQSSLVVAGMDALSDPANLTRRANQRHHSIIARFVKPLMALPVGLSA